MAINCGDTLSLQDLQTAKKHQRFEAEVITGKAGGVASSANIDYATNPVTGQTQKTLPAVLRDAGFQPASFDFTTGGTLGVNDRDKVVYDPVSKAWYSWGGALPHVIAASTNPVGVADWKPQTDPDLRTELFTNYIDWVTPDAYKLPTDADDTDSFIRAFAVSKRIQLLGRTYHVKPDVISWDYDDIYIIGEGSQKSKIVANAAGNALIYLAGSPAHPDYVRLNISLQGVTLDGNNLAQHCFMTGASQSPVLTYDVFITRAVSHGMVHVRGWSVFCYGLTIKNCGGDGMQLLADNNNCHYMGHWGDNGGRGVYIQNADLVSLTGSSEGNGQEGLVISATGTVLPPLANSTTSQVNTSSFYAEGNGKSAAGTYAEIRIGGGEGLVRDVCLRDTRVSCAASGIGIHFGKNLTNIQLDNVAIYQVQAPTNAHLRFSSEYTSLASIAAAGISFQNFNCLDNIVLQGFSDPNLDTQAFVRGGGSTSGTSRNKKFEYEMLSGDNNLGEYRKRFVRGANIVGEIGILPNTQMFINAADPSGILAFQTASQERARFGPQGFLKANHVANYNGLTALQHEFSGASASQHIVTISNQATGTPNGLNINFTAADPNNTTQSFLTAVGQGSTKFVVWSNGNVVNLNNSYGAISDGKLKDGVANAKSAWDEFKQYRFVNYYLKSDPEKKKLLGVISQEMQEVSPALVGESPEMHEVPYYDLKLGWTTKLEPTGKVHQNVNYSVLYLKACVTIQELMARVEALENKLN